MMDTKFLIPMVITLSLLCSFAVADVLLPTKTNVYFELDGRPYNQLVDFTVNCYGFTYSPGPPVEKEAGTYEPEQVFSFSASCPEYGCEIYETYYLNYRHIDYCDLEGKTNGESFTVYNYSDSPIDFSKCDDMHQYAMSTTGPGGETIYYAPTPEYKECMGDKIKTEGECDKYLEEIPESSFEKDNNGYPLDRECELRFDLTGKITSPEPINPIPVEVCGDGDCTGAETCSTCFQDCGACSEPNNPIEATKAREGGDNTVMILLAVILVLIALLALVLLKKKR